MKIDSSDKMSVFCFVLTLYDFLELFDFGQNTTKSMHELKYSDGGREGGVNASTSTSMGFGKCSGGVLNDAWTIICVVGDPPHRIFPELRDPYAQRRFQSPSA